MKTSILAALLSGVTAAFGQGQVNFDNFLDSQFVAPIYGPDPSNPSLSLSGQSAAGTPAGTTVYGGPLLQGTRYVAALYAGPAGTTDPSALLLVASSLFYTSLSNSFPAGVFHEVDGVVIPGYAQWRQL